MDIHMDIHVHMDIHGYPYEVLDIHRKSELWISWISKWISKVSESQMLYPVAHSRTRARAHPIRPSLTQTL